ncbi:MAG: sigma-54-dependent Fis family transcriptional regulator [Bdellovibrionales bacterium]|nr:sigma-54-dependent Fis family transcriptional regulator [Bdellovibrionales bacterium]
MNQDLENQLESIDWEQIKKLRVTRKVIQALEDLEVPGLFLTPSNRRKDARKKYLGYGSRKMLKVAEKPFFTFRDVSILDTIAVHTTALEKYNEGCTHSIDEAINTEEVTKVQDPFGLSHLSCVIKAGGEHIGVLRVGVFISGKLDDLTFEKIKESFIGCGVQSKNIETDIRKLPVFASEKIAVLKNLLQMLCEEIGTYLEETQNQGTQSVVSEQDNYHGLISKNAQIKDIVRQIELIGASDSSVIIYGESGTGKELVANLIHHNSSRNKDPFVTINCAALTETLLEAELFGYKKGAFTGAIADKKGLFEVADKGTIFLDEVGEMSLSLQVKILRLIQEGTFMRVGDTNLRKVDVRVISATHRDLRKFIELGKFREDLYYRLAVVELTLPPLRDRVEDIPLLAQHFLAEFSQKTRKSGITISAEAMKVFNEYFWPGNVRELRNEIERLVALNQNDKLLRSKDLSKKFFYETYPENIMVAEEEEEGFIKRLVDDFEKGLLSKYLQKHKWNKTKVAKFCGITRQGLNKKISKYRLDRRR